VLPGGTMKEKERKYWLFFCFILFGLAILLAIYSPGM
jgi:hypothetical protein